MEEQFTNRRFPILIYSNTNMLYENAYLKINRL